VKTISTAGFKENGRSGANSWQWKLFSLWAHGRPYDGKTMVVLSTDCPPSKQRKQFSPPAQMSTMLHLLRSSDEKFHMIQLWKPLGTKPPFNPLLSLAIHFFTHYFHLLPSPNLKVAHVSPRLPILKGCTLLPCSKVGN
jgi:hypothetical protein